MPFSKKTDLKGFHSFPQTSFRGRARETPLFLKGGFPQHIQPYKQTVYHINNKLIIDFALFVCYNISVSLQETNHMKGR